MKKKNIMIEALSETIHKQELENVQKRLKKK